MHCECLLTKNSLYIINVCDRWKFPFHGGALKTKQIIFNNLSKMARKSSLKPFNFEISIGGKTVQTGTVNEKNAANAVESALAEWQEENKEENRSLNDLTMTVSIVGPVMVMEEEEAVTEQPKAEVVKEKKVKKEKVSQE
jgi:hypothetical protein